MTTPTVTPVTISNGTSLSPAVLIGPKTLVGVALPSGWAAANLSLQASWDGTNYFEFGNSAGLFAITTSGTVGEVIGLDPNIFRGIVAIKIRSGTAASPVNQVGDQLVQVITVPLV